MTTMNISWRTSGIKGQV